MFNLTPLRSKKNSFFADTTKPQFAADPIELSRRLAQKGLMMGVMMEDNTVTLHLIGSLNAKHCITFKELVKDFLNCGCNRFVFDLSNVKDLDSAGVAVLVWANNQTLASGGWVTVTAPGPALYSKLVSVNFHHLVTIENFVLA